MKRCYQNVDFSVVDFDEGSIEIKNKFLFTSLKDFQFEWVVNKNGEVVKTGTMELDTKPGCSQQVKIDFTLSGHSHGSIF